MIPAGKLPYFDGWRGLAVTLLLIGHFFPIPGVNIGNFGVNLFFVLSGLLMTKILVVDRVAIPVFYRRRIARIFPAFLFYAIVIALLCLCFTTVFSWKELISAITLTKNYFYSDGGEKMPLGHIWSLSVEEHSYIVLSGLAVLARAGRVNIKTSLALTICMMMAMCTFYYVTAPADQIYAVIHRSEVAALPVFAAGLFMLAPRTAHRFDYLMAPLAFSIACMVQWWSVPFLIRIIVGSLALAVCVNTIGKSSNWLLTLLSIQPLRALGVWSYSIYLWQQPFYLLQERGLPSAIGMLCGVLCGVISYYLIESPARRFLNETWGKQSEVIASGEKAVAPAVSKPVS